MTWNAPCLGVDIGGVIIDRVRGDGSDTSMFGTRYLETPEVEGAIDTIAALAKGPFQGRVFVVSKAGDRMQRKSREWLLHHDFFARTGIPEANLRFCYARAEKLGIAKDLGISHFVDDRCEVLYHLSKAVQTLVLFRGSACDKDDYPTIWDRIKKVMTWAEVREVLA